MKQTNLKLSRYYYEKDRRSNVIDPDCKDKDTLALIKYISEEDKLDKLLENQQILKTPIVCNGKQATVGYQPEVWKGWS